MNKHWFVDTLDARAGLCFASYRTKSVNPDDVSNENVETSVYISAPGFSPTYIVNGSVPLSSTKGSFQHRLIVGESEVPFGQLDELIELVRRLYIASGGGGGFEGGGISGLPPSPEGPDQRESGENTLMRDKTFNDDGAIRLDLVFAKIIDKIYKNQPRESHSPLNTEQLLQKKLLQLVDQNAGANNFNQYLILNAAHHLYFELVSKLSSRGPIPIEQFMAWHTSARSLGRMVESIGIFWKLRPVETLLNKQLSSWHQAQIVAEQDRFDGFPVTYGDLFHPGLFDRWHPVHYPHLQPTEYMPMDPIRILKSVPIPTRLTAHFNSGCLQAGGVSLFSLLTLASTSPLILQRDTTITELLVFAACFLNSFDKVHTPYKSNLVQRSALAWLSATLPHYIFNAQLEKLIEDAPSLRYTSN